MDIPQKLCAIDFGSWSTKVAALVDNRHYEILVNEANFRETPSVVAFSDSERLIGQPGVIKMKSNFCNTLRSPLRLLGLNQKKHMIQEQLRYSTVSHQVVGSCLKFFPQYGGQRVEKNPQEFITALMTKAKLIVESHSISPETYFLSIPSYLNNGERKALKLCAQAAGYKNVNLIEQWEAIAAEYIFFRQKELAAESDPRLVIFVDVGYTKFSAHACVVSKNEASLLDFQTLRYAGSRNMDRMLIEFYDDIFKKRFKEHIESNLKSLVKLAESVEIQRKKLSANTQNHLNIECILGEDDLEYTMKREQLENILMPVFGEFATSMQNLKSRVEPLMRIHSFEIIGGASRTPFFQEVAKNIFGIDPSKTLNTSESVARGAAIAGAMRLGLLGGRTINFKRTLRFGIFCCIHSLAHQKEHGRNVSLYDMSFKKPVFTVSQEIPSNQLVKIPCKGPVEVVVFSEQHMGSNVLGYLRFNGDEGLAFLIDLDGILRARLMSRENFDVYDLGECLSVEKSVELQEKEEAMKKRDYNFNISYEIRNQLESLMYRMKANFSSEWKDFVSEEEAHNTLETIQNYEDWLSELKEPDAAKFKQMMESLFAIDEMITARKESYHKRSGLIRKFKEKYSLYSKVYKGKHEKLIALQDLKEKFDELEAREISVYWDGSYLNEDVLNKILEEVEKIKK